MRIDAYACDVIVLRGWSLGETPVSVIVGRDAKKFEAGRILGVGRASLAGLGRLVAQAVKGSYCDLHDHQRKLAIRLACRTGRSATATR